MKRRARTMERRSIDWHVVFELRCRSKRGEALSEADHKLVREAFEADPERYAEMNREIFEATAPFGSR